MRKISISILIAFLLVCVGYFGWKRYNNLFFLGNYNSITLRCRVIDDACGGCYPPWKIDSSFNVSEYQNLLNKSIEVVYHGKALESQLDTIDGNCILCSEFYITGKLRKTLSGKYKLVADNYALIKDSICCNNN